MTDKANLLYENHGRTTSNREKKSKKIEDRIVLTEYLYPSFNCHYARK
jgi:hypothetical protein